MNLFYPKICHCIRKGSFHLNLIFQLKQEQHVPSPLWSCDSLYPKHLHWGGGGGLAGWLRVAPLNLLRKNFHWEKKITESINTCATWPLCHLFLMNWQALPPTPMGAGDHKTRRILVELQDSLRSESIDSEAIIPNRPQACQVESFFFFSKTSTRMIFSGICVLTESFLWLYTQFPIKDSPEVLSEWERKMNKDLLGLLEVGERLFKKDLKKEEGVFTWKR